MKILRQIRAVSPVKGGQSYAKARDFLDASGLQPERDRSVVDQGHAHTGAEASGLYVPMGLSGGAHHGLEQAQAQVR
jgi:hypothetical protein